MKYDSDQELGKLTDEENSDVPQEKITEGAIKQKDMEDLIDLVSKRTTETTLKYYFENLLAESIEYWIDVMKSVINYYHLTSLKVFLNDSFIIPAYKLQVKRIIKYLKVDIMNKMLEKDVTRETTRDQLEEILQKDEECPFLLKWAIKFIDRESYELFIAVLFDELNSPFMEENE